jgi:hypothetical protein
MESSQLMWKVMGVMARTSSECVCEKYGWCTILMRHIFTLPCEIKTKPS